MSRSSTSSPDILGPAGDADFLISSPVKPSFTGRQSIMSPANFGPLTSTPARGRPKRQRVSLSPAKSAHSIRFDDVLLPASPTMKLNANTAGGGSPARRVSLSPEKGQEMMLPPPDENADANGNVSPWRIRVTLEATQDENENATPGRKKSRAGAAKAKTTKVPLKGDSSPLAQTPGRKRGRPRKSDLQAREATPVPNAGSPGHTPGPVGTAGQGQKRKRGRPRKSVPVVEAETNTEAEHERGASMDAPIPSVERDEQRWSPLNMAADADSDDGFAGGDMEDPFGPVQEHPPRVAFESPHEIPDPAIDTGHAVSTPSRMPTPAGASQAASPENTLHAGHTPGPRIYPSPTSSSQVDEDAARKGLNIDNASRPEEFQQMNDPTDEHREYDSIMESEGFSMISLDTLPSAKQHGISSKNLKATKGPLKPFLERETTGAGAGDRLKRRVSAANRERSSPNPLLTTSPDHPPPRFSRSPASGLSQEQPIAEGHYMHDAPTSAPVPTKTFKRRPLPRLARIVRVGAALEGCLRLEQARSQVSSTFAVDGCIQRLESLFHDIHPDMQRDIRAGLVLGHEIAHRRHQAQVEQARRAAAEATARKEAEDARERNKRSTPQRGPADYTVNSDMRRRMDEWQREREAISREIEMANSSQVIVIDSDTPAPHNQDDDDVSEDPKDAEPQEELQDDGSEGQHQEEPQSEHDQEDLSDDESEDIWQEEARVSHRSSHGQSKDEPPSRASHTSSSRKSSPYTGPSDDVSTASPAFWVKNTDPIPNLGPSKVKQLREQEVDLSDLYQEDYTPRHYQYYYGKSSPPSAGGRSQQLRNTPDRPRSHRGMVEQSQSEEGSPINDNSGQQTRTYGHATSIEDPEDAGQSVPDAAVAEERSVHDDMVVTPVRSKQTNADVQGSSWFRRLTSFTPGWLKAPGRRLDEDIPEDDEELPDADVESVSEESEETEEEEEPNIPQSIEHSPEQSSSKQVGVPLGEPRNKKRSKALALSGYFTNQHYAALRHLYRIAKDFPDSFPYHPRRGHSAMLGDWIWTSDGTHGVPVTEGQFAIIDRFVEKLTDTDFQNGGDGGIGWTEADLHRRLVSVILGEQIREERKAQAREEEAQRRETAAESWLPWPFRARR